MKEDMTCTHCGNKFPHRKNKMYCSASCKTMAHRDRQNGVTTVNEIAGEKFSKERATFFMSDYEAWTNHGYYPFHLYCFLIKGFSEKENAEFLSQYANSIVMDEKFDRNIEETSHPLCKEYKKFLELFFSNKYLIKQQNLQHVTETI